MLQYANKDCVQGSKSCLYAGPLQGFKSTMAKWFWRHLLCIPHHTRLIQTHALSLSQKGQKFVHEMTFEMEATDKFSSNFFRNLSNWRTLFLLKFWSSESETSCTIEVRL